MLVNTLKKVKQKIKIVAYGSYGSRKSSFAVDCATMKNEDGSPMKVLYIDVETSSLGDSHLERLEEKGVDLNNIMLVETKSISEIHEILKKIINKESFYEIDENGSETDNVILDGDGKPFFPDFLVIDSLSAIAQDEKVMAYEVSKIRQKVRNSNSDKTSSEKMIAEATANVELGDYSRLKNIGEKLISEIIRKVNIHTCIIARDKEEKKTVGKSMVAVSTGRQVIDVWDFVLYEANAVVHLKKEIDEDGNTVRVYGVLEDKDRMGVFKPGEEIENPLISMWQQVIDKNVSRQDGNIVKRQTVEAMVEKSISDVESHFTKPNKAEMITTIMDKIDKSLPDVRTKVAQKLKQHGISPKDLKDGSISDEKLKLAFELLEEY